MTAPRNPAGELVLTMADFDASHADYGDALRWLELYARRDPLPPAYEEKRRLWSSRTSAGAGALTSRRALALEPLHD